MVASFRALFIMRTGAKKLLFTSTTFQWPSGKWPSLVSDENTGRHPWRPRGDRDEGSTLRITFFAYKTKRQLSISRGFLFQLTGKGGQQQFYPGIIERLLDNPI